MIKNCTIIALIIVCLAGGCKRAKSEKANADKMALENEKMATAYTFLLNKMQDDNVALIASKDDENLSLIQNIIRREGLKIEVENYNNIEKGPDLCHYSKSTKKLVAIIEAAKRNEKSYYISYYIGPEGGASKEILLEKRNGNWTVVNDDGMWSVK